MVSKAPDPDDIDVQVTQIEGVSVYLAVAVHAPSGHRARATAPCARRARINAVSALRAQIEAWAEFNEAMQAGRDNVTPYFRAVEGPE